MSIELLDIIETLNTILGHVSFHHNFESMDKFSNCSLDVQKYFLYNLSQSRINFLWLSTNWCPTSIVDVLDLHWSSLLNATVLTPVNLVGLEVLNLANPLTVLCGDTTNILLLPKLVNANSNDFQWLFTLHAPDQVLSFNLFNGAYFDQGNNEITFIDLSRIPQLHGLTVKLYFLENNSWTPYNHSSTSEYSMPIEMKTGNSLYEAWLKNKITPNVNDSYLSLSNTTYFGDNTGSDSE